MRGSPPPRSGSGRGFGRLIDRRPASTETAPSSPFPGPGRRHAATPVAASIRPASAKTTLAPVVNSPPILGPNSTRSSSCSARSARQSEMPRRAVADRAVLGLSAPCVMAITVTNWPWEELVGCRPRGTHGEEFGEAVRVFVARHPAGAGGPLPRLWSRDLLCGDPRRRGHLRRSRLPRPFGGERLGGAPERTHHLAGTKQPGRAQPRLAGAEPASRALAIGARLGIGSQRQRAPLCLGRHAHPAPAVGASFRFRTAWAARRAMAAAGG